ncbi:unnamed protein product [Oncorhynchus mykiss]|uniref:TNFAIP3-interacting protein 1 n=1 Tax=Oncorhynchus mykiss TaxID=8022 RepID=A0A060Y101_ONCMY|nr:unnamed protein product [Oncorhynchus mykiss]
MEGKGPYRIYDPGGGEAKPREAREEGSSGGGGSYRLLLEENSVLRERMKGLKSLGDLLEESQWEASKLRQRVEELVRDNEALKSSTSSFATSLCMGGPVQTETQEMGFLHDYSLFTAVRYHQWPSAVKNVIVLCVCVCVCVAYIQNHSMHLFVSRRITFSKIVKCVYSVPSQNGNTTEKEKAPAKPCDPEAYEKKIKLLEKQRKDVLEVNKQWDVQWNSMKSQFEQKITDLRQRLADSQKAVQELEAEREQRQRDYDKKLLLAKSKIENVQGEKECLNSETTELKQKVRYLQDQLLPLSKQREYQEKEIQRLNRALEEALNLHPPPSSQQPPVQGASGNHGDGPSNLRRQELLTQIAVLMEQVKIFEEDFRKERSDRERMNEEKEDLRRQVERLQGQMTNLTNQLHQAQNECQRERTERCKLERLQMQHHKQGQQQQERRTSDPSSGNMNGPLSPPYCGPFVQVAPGGGLDGWPIHPRIPTNPTVSAGSVAPPGRGDFPPLTTVRGTPWQQSFPQPRGSRGPGAGEGSRPPPENTDQSTATGFVKRERQNIDPGKH